MTVQEEILALFVNIFTAHNLFFLFMCKMLEGNKNVYQTNGTLPYITVMVLAGKKRNLKNHDITRASLMGMLFKNI